MLMLAWSLAEPIQALSLVGQDFKAWARWQQATEAFAWMDDKREASVLSFQLFYTRYHLQPLLHRLDRMLMVHSIEGRVPFLENELMHFAFNLGINQKFDGNNTKLLLKQVALRHLPANIVKRFLGQKSKLRFEPSRQAHALLFIPHLSRRMDLGKRCHLQTLKIPHHSISESKNAD